MDRRTALTLLASAPLAACEQSVKVGASGGTMVTTASDVVADMERLGTSPWPTRDPFLFCAYHNDAYPKGNGQFGPAESLAGRRIGMDFDPRNRWRMYHGDTVPGFPQHPHRGFETVTIVRKGRVDHADSLGAAARYGNGDVQWLTAGGGIVHAEMFPLLSEQEDNPLELFQIWLNLPSVDKMVAPHFSMLWSETIPKQILLDAEGKATELAVIAGTYGTLRPPEPPPKSWAARATSNVAIWTLKLAPFARFTLPSVAPSTDRTLYFFRGKDMRIGTRNVSVNHVVALRPELAAELVNGAEESEVLLLQGRPIEEPVAMHGPFVMNTTAELERAYRDYRATRFGGWPWPSDGPVHAREARFARHADGRIEKKS